jgi:hypothetical protein
MLISKLMLIFIIANVCYKNITVLIKFIINYSLILHKHNIELGLLR